MDTDSHGSAHSFVFDSAFIRLDLWPSALRYHKIRMTSHSLSRRRFLAAAAATPLGMALAQRPGRELISEAGVKVPVGLELYSVRDQLAKDLPGTVTTVAKMGYKVVEFYAPYFSWTPAQAKDVRKLLDDLGIRCNSTHNGPP